MHTIMYVCTLGMFIYVAYMDIYFYTCVFEILPRIFDYILDCTLLQWNDK